MRRILCPACLVLAPAPGAECRGGAERVRVDTPNFIIIGAVGEGRLRSIGTQFEGFRQRCRACSSRVTTAVPTVVVVSGRQTLDPSAALSGQEGPDRRPVRAAPGRQLHPHRSRSRVRLAAPVFHEYAHLVVSNVAPDLPVWMNEGSPSTTARSRWGTMECRDVRRPIDHAHSRALTEV
jgi:hypothetical protein